MKKLIIFFLLVISISGYSQRYLTENNQLGVFRGSVYIPNAVTFGSTDTITSPAFSVFGVSFSGIGTIRYRGADSSLYLYYSITNPKHWIRLGTGSSSSWGAITGTLSAQSDLQTALNAKQNSITLGTNLQYVAGDLTLRTFNSDVFSAIGTGTFNTPLTFSGSTFGINRVTSSIDGYLGAGDYTNFLSAYNKEITNLTIGGNTTKTVTIFLHDGTQYQASFADNTGAAGSGIHSINTDSTVNMTFAIGTAGTDVGLTNTPAGTFTWNFPTASASNRGVVSAADWSSFNAKLANSDTVSKLATKWWAKNYTDTTTSIHYVNKDSLGNYKIQTIAPLHVAFNTILNNVPDTLLMDSADHTHDGYLVHADWDKLQFGYNKTSIGMSVSSFILSLNKQDGSSISVALPLTPANGAAGNIQYSDGGGGFTSTSNFNIASGILNLNNNDLQIHNSLSGVTGTHWLKSDRALMTVVTSTVGSEMFGNSTFLRLSYGSSDFGNVFGGATFNRMTFDNSGINILSQSPYGNHIFLSAGTVSVSPLSGTGTRMVVANATGDLSSQAIPSGNSLTSTQVGFGNGSNVLTGSANLTYLTANNGTLQMGSNSATSTATPTIFNMGGTYFSGSGNAKLQIFNDGTHVYGIGVASGEMSYVIGDAVSDHVWYTNGSAVMRLSNAGSFTVGSGDLTGMPTPSIVTGIFNNSGNGTLLGSGFRANQTGATTGTTQALEGYTKTSNASGNINLSIGTIGNVEHSGAGTVSEMRGVQGGVVIKSGGTVTSAYAGYFAPTIISTGSTTVTNSYGLYIADHTPGSGTITNKYNIYAHDGAGINYFAGNTQVNHIGGNGSAPSVVVGGSVTGTVSVVGNDLGGTVTLVITSPSSLATLDALFTLTFASAYSSTPNVVFSPANAAAISNVPTAYVKNTGTTSFQLAVANSGTYGATTYIWTYRVAN